MGEMNMSRFFVKNADGTYEVNGGVYSLKIRKNLFEVRQDGVLFCTLDVRSAVPVTVYDENGVCPDEKNGFTPDTDEAAPDIARIDEEDGKVTFVYESSSSLWKKEYRLICDRLRFRYEITVSGHGNIDGVSYFSGDGKGSFYEFSHLYFPCKPWNDWEDYSVKSSQDVSRKPVLMCPPMACYSFRCVNAEARLGLGLVCERGHHNYHCFDYKTKREDMRSRFVLTTDQYGHETVDGSLTLPAIVGFYGHTDLDVFREYTNYYFDQGIARKKADMTVPRFWRGPIVCGWIEQMIEGSVTGINASDHANEAFYERICSEIKHHGLKPTAIIIDDKWQKEYAYPTADEKKFPDMRAFSDRRRAEGIRTLLWFKLWDIEGAPEETIQVCRSGAWQCDMLSRKNVEKLDAAIYKALSSDEGCYNCDGFKLDFAMDNPIGRNVHSDTGKYGIELMYELISHIYHKAKEVKPDALINCSPCHPYFADVCDHARLHDYEPCDRRNFDDMKERASLFEIALPFSLIDTDNAAFYNRRDTVNYLQSQHLLGVPDLYSLTGTPECPLDDDDFAAIRQLWEEYSARIDRMYE